MHEHVIKKMRALNEPAPLPLNLPLKEDIDKAEEKAELIFPKDFKEFLLNLSDVSYAALEPVQVSVPKSHNYFLKVLKRAREYGVPDGHLPICEDNADFYCMNIAGEILFWSHNAMNFNGEKWPSIWDWIEQVWIEESKE